MPLVWKLQTQPTHVPGMLKPAKGPVCQGSDSHNRLASLRSSLVLLDGATVPSWSSSQGLSYPLAPLRRAPAFPLHKQSNNLTPKPGAMHPVRLEWNLQTSRSISHPSVKIVFAPDRQVSASSADFATHGIEGTSGQSGVRRPRVARASFWSSP